MSSDVILVKEHGCIYGWMNGTNSDNDISIKTIMANQTMVIPNMVGRNMVTPNMVARNLVTPNIVMLNIGDHKRNIFTFLIFTFNFFFNLTSDDRSVKEHGWMDGCMMGGWMDVWMDGWMDDGWVDG